jgi:hypothetical protein
MKKIRFLLLIMIFGISCTKTASLAPVTKTADFADKTVSTLYVIKAGNHYSDQNMLQVMNRNSMAATVTFDSSAIYASRDAVNQADVNKVMGFSDGGTDHQHNSARLGWSWSGANLVLYAYAYVNQVRVVKTLGNFPLNSPIDCTIKAEKDFYYFTAGNAADSIPRYCVDYTGSRYKLFPYFGGDEIAPHDVRILVEEK